MLLYRPWLASFVLALVLLPSMAAAQGASTLVRGRVVDGLTQHVLAGATVSIDGTDKSVVTDDDGDFVLADVPAGNRVLVISYLGRKSQQIEVRVVAGETLTQVVTFDQPYVYQDSVIVGADLIVGAQARALNQQKNALNIINVASADQLGSFPDPNAAESTQRIPGITITKDQGEGRYVSVRGTEPRLNSMMIDGERMPAPDPLLRQVALDVVPSELLQAIEVSKALTPDMDADSIGGSVNLVLKRAPETLSLFGRIGGGYNSLQDSFGQSNYSLSAGGRFAGGRAGAIVSLAGSETNRANNDIEVSYTSTLGMADFDPRYYEVNRGRFGATGALDFRGNPGSNYTLRGVFNRFIDDHEKRDRMRQRVANRRIERERRDRTHIERIMSLGLDGGSMVGRGALEFKVFGAYSDQTDPLTMTTIFRQNNVNFAPNVSATQIDPDNIQANPLNEDLNASTFNSQLRATNYSKDRDLVGSADFRLPIGGGASSMSFLKTGFKVRGKAKGRTRNETTYTTTATLRLPDFVLHDPVDPFLDGRYNLTPYIDQALVERIPDMVPTTATRNHARDAEEFDGDEWTTAGYAMAEIYASPRLTIVPGLRYEYTAADYTGRDVQFLPNGTWAGTTPITSSHHYGIPAPSLHTRFALTPNTNVRAAVTRTLARPNYYDTVPYRAQDDAAATVTVGNADLQPTTSWNIDVLGEHYLPSIGVVSAGFFYKHLTDYIYTYTFDESINNSIYHVTQPQNGDAADLHGVELAIQDQLTFLPGPLAGIGVYANYTFTDSTAAIPGHADSPLPGQSKHVGNVAVSYERYGFSGRVSMNFHGSYIDQIGSAPLLDRYYDEAKQLDITLSQRVTRNFRAYVDLLNMNDALLRYYQGVPDRTLQEEHYDWSLNFGVRFDF